MSPKHKEAHVQDWRYRAKQISRPLLPLLLGLVLGLCLGLVAGFIVAWSLCLKLLAILVLIPLAPGGW